MLCSFRDCYLLVIEMSCSLAKLGPTLTSAPFYIVNWHESRASNEYSKNSNFEYELVNPSILESEYKPDEFCRQWQAFTGGGEPANEEEEAQSSAQSSWCDTTRHLIPVFAAPAARRQGFRGACGSADKGRNAIDVFAINVTYD